MTASPMSGAATFGWRTRCEGMDVYHIWCDLKDGREDKAFAAADEEYARILSALLAEAKK